MNNRSLPAGNIFGIFAIACAVSISDFKDGANGATVFTGYTLETDVVFTAVLRVGMSAEGPSIRHLAGRRAGETTRYFWETPEKVT